MKKAKEFILGALVGSMVMGGCVTVFGSSGTKTIQAIYKNIKIVVDGKEVKTDKEPFVYDGTTYLPVRAVAVAVGKEVKWDSSTQTVILGEDLRKTQPVSNLKKEDFYGIKYEVPVSWGDAVNNPKSRYYYPSGGMLVLQYSGMTINSSDLKDKAVLDGFTEGISEGSSGFEVLDLKHSTINSVDVAILSTKGSVSSGGRTANLEKIVLINSNQGLITAIYSNFEEKSQLSSTEFDKMINSISIAGTQVKSDSNNSVNPEVESDNKSKNNLSTISKAEFEKLNTGMTYREVVEMVGGYGELLSEVGSVGDEYHTAVYMWKGEGSIGANANVTFQNGKVIMKAQAGLK